MSTQEENQVFFFFYYHPVIYSSNLFSSLDNMLGNKDIKIKTQRPVCTKYTFSFREIGT